MESRSIIRGYRALEVKAGKSRVQIWRDIRAGKFPAPVKVGENSVAWYVDEVNAWLEARPRVNYAPAPTA